ncbi:MAG: hypothetical protein QNK04_18885 [Myxococcota bacterium]|nr:hypothetical protein [Myxococcota bacterium]
MSINESAANEVLDILRDNLPDFFRAQQVDNRFLAGLVFDFYVDALYLDSAPPTCDALDRALGDIEQLLGETARLMRQPDLVPPLQLPVEKRRLAVANTQVAFVRRWERIRPQLRFKRAVEVMSDLSWFVRARDEGFDPGLEWDGFYRFLENAVIDRRTFDERRTRKVQLGVIEEIKEILEDRVGSRARELAPELPWAKEFEEGVDELEVDDVAGYSPDQRIFVSVRGDFGFEASVREVVMGPNRIRIDPGTPGKSARGPRGVFQAPDEVSEEEWKDLVLVGVVRLRRKLKKARKKLVRVVDRVREAEATRVAFKERSVYRPEDLSQLEDKLAPVFESVRRYQDDLEDIVPAER